MDWRVEIATAESLEQGSDQLSVSIRDERHAEGALWRALRRAEVGDLLLGYESALRVTVTPTQDALDLDVAGLDS